MADNEATGGARPLRFGVVAPLRTDLPAWRDQVRRIADSGYSTLLMPDVQQWQPAPGPTLAVAATLADASLPLLSASIVIGYFGHLSFRARRWKTMLDPLKEHVSFYNLFSTTAIGYAISWLTPGRIGEVARPVLLARREGIPVAGVLATAAIERVLDVVTIVGLAAFVLRR